MGMIATADSLRLEEADKTAAYTSSFEPVYWECVFMKDSIQGSWIQKGKKVQTIQLHEIQEDNYFSLKVFKDTAKAFPGKDLFMPFYLRWGKKKINNGFVKKLKKQ